MNAGDGIRPLSPSSRPAMTAFDSRTRSTVGSIQDAPTPDLSTRFVAALIDGVVVSMLSLALGWLPLIGGLLAPLYILMRDGFTAGPVEYRSLGKFVMGLRPRRLDGQPMDLETSLLRNAFLGVAVLGPFIGAVPFIGWLLGPFVSVAAFVALFVETMRLVRSSDQRRWGDRLAGTRVVETGDALV